MKIQLDIPKEFNKALKHYKIDGDFKNLQEALIDILIKFINEKNEKI